MSEKSPAAVTRVPGLALTDHTFVVALDHGQPEAGSIEVFAREVVAVDKVGEDLPWLLFLQGGPGGKAPRPGAPGGWIREAVKTHRVLLLDQRGTGRSTPLTAHTVAGMSDAAIAERVRLMRADSIVADAEVIRAQLLGDRQWDTLGQSYGGYVTLTYLCMAPQALGTCYVTGGLPGIAATKDDLYAFTYPRVAAKNEAFYRRYPDDVARVRAIADHLDSHEVRLPDGDRLTTQRLRSLGLVFGVSDGYERIHWLLEEAWHGGELADGFLYQVMSETGFVDTPLFALQEYTYGAPGQSTAWAAERAIANYPEFAADATPLLFTGEMMYPWMFDEIRALKPFAGAADRLAAVDDWNALYDLDRLAANEVPVVAAVYVEDMYVASELQQDTLARLGNARAWITNEYEHDGVRDPRVLSRLMDLAAGRC